MIDEQSWTTQLQEEGFNDVFTWEDGPNVYYPDHQHPDATARIILEGEMVVTVNGEARIYRAGDRFDVPARTAHSARVGPEGCKYVVGEK